MKRPQKVVAYIVHEGRLLVFAHADGRFDHSGIQVPAGTVRPNESPDDAVLREAFEETNLRGLTIERYLGEGEYDMRPYADAVHVRHYYQLSAAGEQTDSWYAFERGDGTTEPIRFKLFWIPLTQAHVIAAGQAAFVGRMLDNPGS